MDIGAGGIGRGTRIRRVIRLVVGYLVAAVAAVLALTIFGEIATDLIAHQVAPLTVDRAREVAAFIALILGVCVPIAWVPLALTLSVGLRLSLPPFWACLFAGAITGGAAAVGLGLVVAGVAQATSHALWGEIVEFLVYAMPTGAFGGIVFWAICFARR